MKRILLGVFLLALLLTAVVTAGDDTFEIIRQGSKGEAVVRIQERLFDLGYYTYKPTGSYQTVTRSAVMTYQSDSGLMNDGTVGLESYRALFSRGAVRTPFHAVIPLGYTAQSGSLAHGNAIAWPAVKQHLMEGETYTIRSAATDESCNLVYQGGENHAEFAVPQRGTVLDASTVKLLTAWLGDTNSYYKCAVLLDLGGQPVAASIQWNGQNAVCLYTVGSTSHVFGLPDPDHEAMIARVTAG